MESVINVYQSENIGNLAGALAAAQGQFTYATKSCSAIAVGGRPRTYADLQSVLEACRGPLAENGLSVVQTTLPSENGIIIRTTLMHKSNEWIAGVLHLPSDKTEKMGFIQALGSAITYARRYAYAAIVGIAQDDDDAETAQQVLRPVQQRPAPKAEAPAQPHTMSFKEQSEEAKAKREQHIRRAIANNPNPPSAELRAEFLNALKDQGVDMDDAEQVLSYCSLKFQRNILNTREITATEMNKFLGK